jgi:hypothetical protein
VVLTQELRCCGRGGGPCDRPVSAHADHHDGPSLGEQPATATGWQCLNDPWAVLKGLGSCSGASPLHGMARHRGLASPNRPKTRVQHQSSCPSRPLSRCCPGPMVELDCHARSGPRGGCSMTAATWASHASNEHCVWTERHVWPCCGACVYAAVSRPASRKQLQRPHASRRSPWRPPGTLCATHVKFWGQGMLLLKAAWVREVALQGSAARLAPSGGLACCVWP